MKMRKRTLTTMKNWSVYTEWARITTKTSKFVRRPNKVPRLRLSMTLIKMTTRRMTMMTHLPRP